MSRYYCLEQPFWLQTNANRLGDLFQVLNPVKPKKAGHHIELPRALVELLDILLLKMQLFLSCVLLLGHADLVRREVKASHVVYLHLLFEEGLVQLKGRPPVPTAQVENFQRALDPLVVGLDPLGKDWDGRVGDAPLKVVVLDVGFVEVQAGALLLVLV